MLQEQGHPVDRKTVKRLLRNELNLGCRQIAKSLPMGESHFRDQQFEILFRYRDSFLSRGWPVLSIDTKKKEILGKFWRPGTSWTDGKPASWDHDFPTSGWGKVIPYGVYDLARNDALVYLARGADTGQLAVDAIRRWWNRLGKSNYDAHTPILLLADCGGSNGYRITLFHQCLQRLADQLGRTIRVCHLPPYCSKYNPIDHRLFCHITRSLRSLLLTSIKVIRDAVNRTSTWGGLRVVTDLARKRYSAAKPSTQKTPVSEFIIRDENLGQFNYKFQPQTPKLLFP